MYAPVVPNLIEHTHARSSWHKIGHEIRWEVEQNHFDAIGKPCKGAAWCGWPDLKERKTYIWVQGWMCVCGLWGVWTMLCNICPVPSIPIVSSYLPTFSSTTTKPLHQKTLISPQHKTFHFGRSSLKDWWQNHVWNQNHSLFLLLCAYSIILALWAFHVWKVVTLLDTNIFAALWENEKLGILIICVTAICWCKQCSARTGI